MHFSLKTKISTPLIAETVDYYQNVFGMKVVEEWNSPNDRGTILAFDDSLEEAYLEVYFDEESYDFSGLSLQFRTENLEAFMDTLPGECAFEGPKARPWGSTYLYLRDPNNLLIIVYEGGL